MTDEKRNDLILRTSNTSMLRNDEEILRIFPLDLAAFSKQIRNPKTLFKK